MTSTPARLVSYPVVCERTLFQLEHQNGALDSCDQAGLVTCCEPRPEWNLFLSEKFSCGDRQSRRDLTSDRAQASCERRLLWPLGPCRGNRILLLAHHFKVFSEYDYGISGDVGVLESGTH